jgi:CBS domain-containing protein
MRDKIFVGEVARRKLGAAYPEETALDAFKKMSEHEIGRILVVDRRNPKKLLGIISKADLMHTLIQQL